MVYGYLLFHPCRYSAVRFPFKRNQTDGWRLSYFLHYHLVVLQVLFNIGMVFFCSRYEPGGTGYNYEYEGRRGRKRDGRYSAGWQRKQVTASCKKCWHRFLLYNKRVFN